MLVQYLVGLCCVRGNPDAVEVVLGDLVTDDASRKKRDVDVTVTINDDGGESWAFKAYEVKDENSPLDVTVVEQLCAKLKDMSSVTHRSIVSSSGFTDGAKAKAEYHGVELYNIEKWTTRVELEFPRFGLQGLPPDAIRFGQSLLFWEGYEVTIEAPAAQGPFTIANTDSIFDSSGVIHPRYKTFGQYKDEILFRSTGKLCLREPARTMGRTLPRFHASGWSVTAEWPYAHTLEVSADDVYVRVDDLIKIEGITITGFMQWKTKLEAPDFRVMRRMRDGEPFAGALIATGQREGQMTVFVMSDSPAMAIHFVELEEKHRNMIRELSLQLPSESEASLS